MPTWKPIPLIPSVVIECDDVEWVYLNKQKDRFIVVTSNRHIKFYSLDGKFMSELDLKLDVFTRDKHRRFWGYDYENSQIQCLTEEGEIIHKFALNKIPERIGFVNESLIISTDSSSICVYDCKGQLIHTLMNEPNTEPWFHLCDDRICILRENNSTMLFFSLTTFEEQPSITYGPIKDITYSNYDNHKIWFNCNYSHMIYTVSSSNIIDHVSLGDNYEIIDFELINDHIIAINKEYDMSVIKMNTNKVIYHTTIPSENILFCMRLANDDKVNDSLCIVYKNKIVIY